jgi:hypothetical protein
MLVEQLFNQAQWERTLTDRQTDIDADRQTDKKGILACGNKLTSKIKNSNISFMPKWIQRDFLGIYVKQF